MDTQANAENRPETAGVASGASGSPSLPIVPGLLTIDPADPEVQWILAMICTRCGRIAHVFQAAGYPIPTHAEEEQAHVILWMLARYQQHGEGWREKCDDELNALREEIALRKANAELRDRQ